MKKLILLAALVAAPALAQSSNYVRGYVTRNGTYVAPHYQTAPDRNPYNNYSTQGNVNPYTGQQGTVNPYAPQPRQMTQPYPTYRPGRGF